MKAVSRVPVKRMITVKAATGSIFLVIDAIGQCSCGKMVLLTRQKPKDQWIPIEHDEINLHRCPLELQRNASLRRIVYGQEPEAIES